MTLSGVVMIDRRQPAVSVIERLVRQLRIGRAVVVPTETDYALAADATNPEAVALTRDLKGRPESNPFSVLIADCAALQHWGITLGTASAGLARAFWPGPMTLILSTDNPIFKTLAADSSVGVRVSPEPTVRAVLRRFGRPILATSANPSGRTLSASQQNRWLNRLAAPGGLVWARPNRYHRHVASTVVDAREATLRIVREGPISFDALTAVWYKK